MSEIKKIKKVETPQAPEAKGPYSQAVRAGDFLFISGQIPLCPLNGEIKGVTIQEQTRQVLENIQAILISEKLSLSHVVKSEIFLKDMHHFQEMNIIYAQFFSSPILPARHTVQVAKLPFDALIEISCTAFFDSL